MEKHDKKNKSYMVIALYVVASITAIYTLFTVYNSHIYISKLVKTQGLVVKDQLSNVISYYMNASMPYLFYTIVIWGIGYIIYKLNNIKVNELNKKYNECKEDSIIENNTNLKKDEEELDSFINTLKIGKENKKLQN